MKQSGNDVEGYRCQKVLVSTQCARISAIQCKSAILSLISFMSRRQCLMGGTVMRSAIPKIAIPRNCDPHPKSITMRSKKY